MKESSLDENFKHKSLFNHLGAELFAKRRKKAEKWVVDQTPTATQIATPTSGPAITAFSDAGMQHVQRSIQQDQIQEKYQQPRAKMVQSPWDAALQTGSSNNAFANIDQQQVYSASTGNVQQYDYGSSTTSSLYSSSKKDVQVSFISRIPIVANLGLHFSIKHHRISPDATWLIAPTFPKDGTDHPWSYPQVNLFCEL